MHWPSVREARDVQVPGQAQLQVLPRLLHRDQGELSEAVDVHALEEVAEDGRVLGEKRFVDAEEGPPGAKDDVPIVEVEFLVSLYLGRLGHVLWGRWADRDTQATD